MTKTLQLRCTTLSPEKRHVAELTGMHGQTLYHQSFSGQSLSADINLPPGMYFLRLRDNNQILYMQKIVIAQ